MGGVVVSSGGVGGGQHKRGKWSTAEDAQLRDAVLEHKGKNWKNIAKAAFGDAKSDVQCLHRWQKVLDPKLVKGPWTKAVSRRTRTAERAVRDEASARPRLILCLCLRLCCGCVVRVLLLRGCDVQEDEKVVSLVERHGPKKWSTIAAALPGRIGKQCRERWHNHLNPHIRKDAWTQEEDRIILNAHSTIGNKCTHQTTPSHRATHTSTCHALAL